MVAGANMTIPYPAQPDFPIRPRQQPASCRAEGFTYIGVLVMVAMLGIVLAAAGEVWHTASKREKEQELLFIGNQFRRAIQQYSAHAPGLASRYPSSLEDLLKDPRYPGTRRYLRKIYPDPMTGKAEWGLIKGPSGEILGVYSLSEDEPVKKTRFSEVDKDFEGKGKYVDWVFMSSSR